MAFGYAMSTHKAQGSQFKVVVLLAERGSKMGGVVQRSNIYTATSRAQERLIVLGVFDDFLQAIATDEVRRLTLLPQLLATKPGDEKGRR